MSAQVNWVPGQTEGRSKAFLEWNWIYLSYELSLTCEGNVNHYKSLQHPIPTRENREHRGNLQNKSVGSAFNCLSANLKGARREATLQTPRALGCHKRWIILPVLCFLLDSLTNKYCRTWSSVIDLWIDSRTVKSKECCCQQGKGLRAFKRNFFGGIWCCHIDHALLEGSLWMVSQNSSINFSDAAILSRKYIYWTLKKTNFGNFLIP